MPSFATLFWFPARNLCANILPFDRLDVILHAITRVEAKAGKEEEEGEGKGGE